MLQTCAELDVTFVPFSPLGRGIFALHTPDPARFKDGDFRKGTPRFTEPNFGYNVARVRAFKAASLEYSIVLDKLYCFASLWEQQIYP